VPGWAIQRTLRDCFGRHQLAGLLTPTLPVTTARKEQTAIDFRADDAGSSEAAYVRFCVAFDLAGLPALSLPCGLDRRNLPIGLHIVGPPLPMGWCCVLAARTSVLLPGTTQYHPWSSQGPAVIRAANRPDSIASRMGCRVLRDTPQRVASRRPTSTAHPVAPAA
jgi:hypothetical protein